MHALSDVGDIPALKIAADRQTDARLRRRIMIAIGNVKLSADNVEKASVIPELLDILSSAPTDFIRAQAATILGGITPTDGEVRKQVIVALKAGLHDQASRWDNWGSGRGTIVNIVQLAASGSLRRLGVSASEIAAASPPMPESRDAVWLTARSFLQGRGYSVTWDPSAKRLEGTRGSSVIRLWAGRNTAEINGHTVTLTAATRVVSSSLRVPETLEAVLADG
jgi:hypothetical protein